LIKIVNYYSSAPPQPICIVYSFLLALPLGFASWVWVFILVPLFMVLCCTHVMFCYGFSGAPLAKAAISLFVYVVNFSQKLNK
jgi:hypothetical protein